MRLVRGQEAAHLSLAGAIRSVAAKIGYSAETCGCGYVGPSVMPAGQGAASVDQRERIKACSARVGSSGKPTRSCARRASISPRRSLTAGPSKDRVHRRTRPIHGSSRSAERCRRRRTIEGGDLVHHSDSQCLSASVGDSYDNALAETVIGLFKTEVFRRLGPWRSLEDVDCERTALLLMDFPQRPSHRCRTRLSCRASDAKFGGGAAGMHRRRASTSGTVAR